MLPIRDHNPSSRTPYVTYALIAANIIVFLLYFPMFSDMARLTLFFDDWALIPSSVSQGEKLHGLVTSMFLHGGIMHLAGNMLFLWIFGDNLEDEMGHFGFAVFYLLSGIGAALFQVAADPGSSIPTVGASGAIAGVMGGYLLLFPRAKIDILFIIFIFFKVFTVPAWAMLGVWFGLQLFSAFLMGSEMTGVAYWAHAGGFIVGAVLAYPAWRRRGGRDYWDVNHGLPPHPEAKYEVGQSRVPSVRRRK